MEMLYEYEFEEDDFLGEEPKEDLNLFLKELNNQDDIDVTINTIVEMWQWDEGEIDSALPLIRGILNLLRNSAYDESNRTQTPNDIAYEIAPTWGYPIPPETD